MMAGEFLDSYESDASAFTELIAVSDLNSAVPSCPGWRLRDLAMHLGHVHRWARECIETDGPAERPEPPVSDSLLVEWFSEGASDLGALLRTSDPESAVWTFGPHPRLMSFWLRRQAQETSMHLWDARYALEQPAQIDESVAADGIAEVFEVFIPRQLKRAQMSQLSEGVRLSLPDGRTFDLGENIATEVSGTASNLLLALWHRIPIEHLTVDGDAQVAREAFSQALTS